MPERLFLTRLEMVPSKDANYDKLHEQLEARGFAREIVDTVGDRYALPTGTYVLASETLQTARVRGLAQEAALAAEPSLKSLLITCEITEADFRLMLVPKPQVQAGRPLVLIRKPRRFAASL